MSPNADASRMRFDQSVVPMQIVLDGDEQAPQLSLVTNDDNKESREFESSSSWVPRLGSSAMLALASAIIDAPQPGHETRLVRFDVRDASMNPVPDDRAESMSEDLIGALQIGGASGAEDVLMRRYRGHLVAAFEVFIDNHLSTIAREGVVFTPDQRVLAETLRSAWQRRRPS